MKFRPYYTMELVQKIMKKTSKYLIYSPLTEKVLTEWPCNTETLFIAEDEEEKNLRRISYLQATKEERMEVEEK